MTHLFFWINLLIGKKIKIDPQDTIVIFFASYFFSFAFSKEIISSSNTFTIIMCSTSTCFLKKLFHLCCNKKLILSLLEFLNLFLLQVLDNKGYNTWFVYFQDQFLYYHWHNKNSNTKIIFHMVKFCFVHVFFKDLSSFILLSHFMDSYLFMFFIFSIISSFIQISIVSLFPITTFSCVEDCSIGSFDKNIFRIK